MLEHDLQALTVAINNLTAAITGAQHTAPVADTAKAEKAGKSSSGTTKSTEAAASAPPATGTSTGPTKAASVQPVADADLSYEKDIMPLVAKAIAMQHREEVIALIAHYKPGAKKLSEALTKEDFPDALVRIHKILGDD